MLSASAELLVLYGNLVAIRQTTVMWSETIGLRTRPVCNQNDVLQGLVLCCETRSCHAHRHNLS